MSMNTSPTNPASEGPPDTGIESVSKTTDPTNQTSNESQSAALYSLMEQTQTATEPSADASETDNPPSTSQSNPSTTDPTTTQPPPSDEIGGGPLHKDVEQKVKVSGSVNYASQNNMNREIGIKSAKYEGKENDSDNTNILA